MGTKFIFYMELINIRIVRVIRSIFRKNRGMVGRDFRRVVLRKSIATLHGLVAEVSIVRPLGIVFMVGLIVFLRRSN